MEKLDNVRKERQMETKKSSRQDTLQNCFSLYIAPRDKQRTRYVKKELSRLRQEAPLDTEFSSTFTNNELAIALKHLKTGKAPDTIYSEFFVHSGKITQKWLIFLKAFKATKIIATG